MKRWLLSTCALLLACASADPGAGSQLPQGQGKRVWDMNGDAGVCEERDPSCVPPAPQGALKAACMDANHSIVLCGCRWVCDGPMS